jgi:alpha-L-arabinofuranosidase
MANLAQTVNVLQALILTDKDKMLLTPTYYVFDMYKVHQDAHSLVVKFDAPTYTYGADALPAVNASASRDSAGAVHISLVNIDPTKKNTVRVPLQGLPSKSIQGQILASAKFTDINTFDQPNKVHSAAFNGAKKSGNELVVEMPAASIVVLELK